VLVSAVAGTIPCGVASDVRGTRDNDQLSEALASDVDRLRHLAFL
jgi:hypothetical protein